MSEKKNHCGTEFDDDCRHVSFAELQVREYVSLFLYLAGILILATFGKIPLGNAPEEASIIHAKAPWVFGAIQFLLYYWPAWISGWLFPIISFVLLLSYPWLASRINQLWARAIFALFTGVWVLLTVLYLF